VALQREGARATKAERRVQRRCAARNTMEESIRGLKKPGQAKPEVSAGNRDVAERNGMQLGRGMGGTQRGCRSLSAQVLAGRARRTGSERQRATWERRTKNVATEEETGIVVSIRNTQGNLRDGGKPPRSKREGDIRERSD